MREMRCDKAEVMHCETLRARDGEGMEEGGSGYLKAS